MAFASEVRREVESTLGSRAALRLLPRLVCPGFETGFVTLDSVLRGGFPVAGTSELIGERSSGRATVAAAYVAERTREGHLCAWIDVGRELDGGAFVANGGDLRRLLVVCCMGEPQSEKKPSPGMRVAASIARTNFRKDKSIGTPGVQNRMFVPTSERVEPVDTDRMPARRGLVVLERRDAMRVAAGPRSEEAAVKTKKPWSRLEQGIKAVDLLIQGGGFRTVVFDLGSLSPQGAQKIPLATWFRWRAALERTNTSLVVLSQMACAGSSAELVLRVQAEMPDAGTVLNGGSYRLQVVRRRFAEQSAETQRRGPQRAETSAWASRATWTA